MPRARSSSLRNPNHPPRGSSTKVDPITNLDAIALIKENLSNNFRNLCLFTLGINTAYRSSELVSIRVGQVQHLKERDFFPLKQGKNCEYRNATLNGEVINAIQCWLREHPDPRPEAPLFRSRKTGKALQSKSITSLVKSWCLDIGLKGRYGSHTLRKTWGYHQRKTFNAQTAVLTRAYGHKSEWQTLQYLCIQPEEIEELYLNEL